MIKTENLTAEYSTREGKTIVLNDIGLSVKKGEYVAILGHNGSGKSTLAKHFNGIIAPLSGTVLVDGHDTRNEDEVYEVRRKVGMVFQNPDNQMVSSVIEDDVAFAPENLGVSREEIRRRVDESLKAVGMYEYRLKSPNFLSGGQKQRIAIAGILAMQPEYIVLDESTAMLDPMGRAEILSTVEKLNKEKGMTVILITHFMNEAVRADRVIVMDKGQVSMEGTPAEIFSQVEKVRELGLDVPQSTELLYELKKEGIDIDGDAFDAEKCVELILSYVRGKEEK